MKNKQPKPSEIMNDAVEKHLHYRNSRLESFAAAYLKMCKCPPDQAVLIEDRSDPLVTKWYFRKKTENES